MAASDVRVVLTTAPTAEAAEKLVTKLVESGHAACGTILNGSTSIYRWEGAVQRESEVVVLLKTSQGAQAGLLEKTKELHPYDVPELLVLPVSDGDPAYLEWVLRETTGGTLGEVVPTSE